MPSQDTEYVVFELNTDESAEATGSTPPHEVWELIGTGTGRDHKTAIDAVLAPRPPEERKGTFGAAPLRNWRDFDFATEVSYDTKAVERTKRPAAAAAAPAGDE